jgi:uncharacterized lipoprotein YddW (UPF0748 family)
MRRAAPRAPHAVDGTVTPHPRGRAPVGPPRGAWPSARARPSRAAALTLFAAALTACVEGADPTLPPDDYPDTGVVAAPDAAPTLDAGLDAGAPTDARAADAEAADAGTTPDLGTFATATVAAPRELRGVWVATVSNIDFPSATNLTVAAAQAELQRVVDLTADAGLNAIFFQARPEGDALYRSMFEPWSRVLTGTQGRDPGYDPLGTLIGLAHARGLEVHAWLNPYRAKSSAASTAVAPHMAERFPDLAYDYGRGTWMDPGAEPVQRRLLDVVRDLASGYPIDGVHLDDYFYPYPETGVPFPDDATYAAYRAGGGALVLAEWRRDNVNRMVEAIDGVVADTRPSARFGISPFGIYRPGQPTGQPAPITGLDQYSAIFSDPPLWIARGWVDYLAPQLYWVTTAPRQPYAALAAWWARIPRAPGTWMMIGNNLSALGSTADWTIDEYLEQLRLTRGEAPQGMAGNIWFSLRPLREGRQGIGDVLRQRAYSTPALTPVVARMRDIPVDPPRVSPTPSGALRVEHAQPDTLRGYALYDRVGGAWVFQGLRRAAAVELMPSSTRRAVSAVGLHGVESRAVVLEP